MVPSVEEGQDLQGGQGWVGWLGKGFSISQRPSQLGVNGGGDR